MERPWALFSALKTKAGWKHYFISAEKPTPQEKVLLILGGHSSYTQILAAIEIARKHGIAMLSLQSYSTYRMQPLNIRFLTPLNTYRVSAIASKLRGKPRSDCRQNILRR
jgi:hypothetical protein